MISASSASVPTSLRILSSNVPPDARPRAGDELVVLRLDRLGRSTRDVLNLVHELKERGASLRVPEPEAWGGW